MRKLRVRTLYHRAETLMAILVSFLDGSKTSAAIIDRFPDVCPLCHERRAPRFIAATTRTGNLRQICFQCTNESCRGLFLSAYVEENAVTFRLAD